MVMDVNWTYCGDHFAIYTYVESLYHTPEINNMVYVNFHYLTQISNLG